MPSAGEESEALFPEVEVRGQRWNVAYECNPVVITPTAKVGAGAVKGTSHTAAGVS